jgi:hypothetical protein
MIIKFKVMQIETIVLIASFLPASALLICFIYPLSKDFHQATKTHCGVSF